MATLAGRMLSGCRRCPRNRVRRDLDPGRHGADRRGVRGAARGRRARASRGAPRLWALGFACFAAGAAAEAYGASYGWSPVTFRIYYLAGGVLAVGFLGLGATCLHARRDVALVMTGAVLATAVAASVGVLSAGVDTALLAEGGLRPPPNEALTGHAFLYAIALNTVGTLALLAGIVRSIVRRERAFANLLIGAGVLVVASSGTLTRIGDAYGIVLAAQLAGLVMIYAGFELATQRAPLRRPAARTTPVGAG